VKSGDSCNYDASRPKFDGNDEKKVKVDEKYLKSNVAVIRLRLQQAGVRLAHLINKTLGQ